MRVGIAHFAFPAIESFISRDQRKSANSVLTQLLRMTSEGGAWRSMLARPRRHANCKRASCSNHSTPNRQSRHVEHGDDRARESLLLPLELFPGGGPSRQPPQSFARLVIVRGCGWGGRGSASADWATYKSFQSSGNSDYLFAWSHPESV